MIGGKGCDARTTLVFPDSRTVDLAKNACYPSPEFLGYPTLHCQSIVIGRHRDPRVAHLCYIGSIRFSHEDIEMTQEVKLRKAGGSIAATLPKEMADRLKLTAGDTVIAIETDRGILLTPYDPDTEEALSIAAEVGRTYRNALRELAK
jgi:putative addiction module antidote